MRGDCDDVSVGFEHRAKHLAGIAMPGVIVDHEVLGKQLQHHAVFGQRHTRWLASWRD